MALAFVYRYNASLSSKIGDAVQLWELRIYRSYEDTDTIPAWALEPPKTLTFDKQGATLEYVGRYDIYKPIIGSKLQFTLKSITEGEFDNFNEGGQYEYRVDLFSYDPSGLVRTLYWRGYILPADSSESLSFAPFDVTFEVIDGLGGLGDFRFPPPTSFDHHITAGGNLLLIDVIKYAIARTGLGLDIYVDSGIKQKKVGDPTSIDALFYDSVVPYAFTGRILKELIEGILIAYNCRIIQTRGSWVIFNASMISTQVSWIRLAWTGTAFTTKGTATPSIDLTKTLHGRPGSDLLYLDGHQITRLPYGSIECVPKDLSPQYYLQDYNFGLGLEGWGFDMGKPVVGWTFYSRAYSPTAPTRPTFSTSQGEHLTGGRSITTDVGVNTVIGYDGTRDVGTFWFMARTPVNTVSVQSPINIDIYYLVKNIDTDEINSVRLITGLILRQTTAGNTFYNYSFPDNDWTATRASNYFASPVFRYTGRGLPSTGSFFTESDIREEHQGQWRRKRITLPPSTLLNSFAGNPFQLDIGFFYPTCENSGGTGTYGRSGTRIFPFTGFFDLFIDRVEVYNEGVTNVRRPHFERIQKDWNTTYRYQPTIVDESVGIAQKIIKTDNLVSDGTEPSVYFKGNDLFPRTLEEVSTQLKLNDFANRLQTFELKVASNRSGIPLHALDRIKVDFNDFKSGYSAAGDQTLFASGKFHLAEGIYDVICYSPNQTTDIAPVDRGTITPDDYVDGNLLPGFYRENIDLIFAEPVVTDATNLPLIIDCVAPEDLTSNSATIVIRIRHGDRNFRRFDILNTSTRITTGGLSTARNAQGEFRWAWTGLTPDTQYTYRTRVYDNDDQVILFKDCNFRTLPGHNITTVYAISVDSDGRVKVLNYSNVPSIEFIGDVADTVLAQSDITIRSVTLPNPIGSGTSPANEFSRKVYPQVAQPTLRRVRVKAYNREPAVFEVTQSTGTLPPIPTVVLTVAGQDIDQTSVGHEASRLTVGYRITDAQVSDLSFLFPGVVIAEVDQSTNPTNPGTFEVVIKANPIAVIRTEVLTAVVTNADGIQRGFDTLAIQQAAKPSDCDGKRPILTFVETSKTAEALGNNITLSFPFTLNCGDPDNIQYVWNFGSVADFATASTGTNAVDVVLQANTSSSARTATLQVVVANTVGTTRVNLTVLQRASPAPRVTISPKEIDLPITGGIAKFTYTIERGVQSDLTLSDYSAWSSRTGFKFEITTGNQGDLWLPVDRNCGFEALRSAVTLSIRNSAGSGSDTAHINQPARPVYTNAPTLAWDPPFRGATALNLPSASSGAQIERYYNISNAIVECDTTIINPISGWLSATRAEVITNSGIRHGLNFRALNRNESTSSRFGTITYRARTQGHTAANISVQIVQPGSVVGPTISVASAEKSVSSRGGFVTFDFDIEEADGTNFTLTKVKSEVEVSGSADWVTNPSWSESSFNTENPFRLRLNVARTRERSTRSDTLTVGIVRNSSTVASVNIKVIQAGLIPTPTVAWSDSSVDNIGASADSVLAEFTLTNADFDDLSFTNNRIIFTGCVVDVSISEGNIYAGTFKILDPSTQSDLQGTGRTRVRLDINTNSGEARSDLVAIIVDNDGGRDCDTIALNQLAGVSPATITWDNPDAYDSVKAASEEGFTLVIHFSVTDAVYSDVSVDSDTVPSWVTAGSVSKRGSSDLRGSVSLEAEANDTDEERSATIRIEIDSDTYFDVSFTQNAGEPPPPPPPTITWENPNAYDSVSSASEFGFTLSIHYSVTNAVYSDVLVSPDTLPVWITAGPSTKRGSSDLTGAITLTAKANPTTSTRTANMRFVVTGGAFFDVALTQNAGSPPPPPPATITWDNEAALSSTISSISEFGFTLSIHYSVTNAVYSDASAVPSSIPSWVSAGSAERRDTNLEGEIVFTIAGNDTDSPRTATLKIALTQGASFNVRISQNASTPTPSVPSLTVNPASRNVSQWEASGVAVSFGYSLQNGLRSQITVPTIPDCITLGSISGTNASGTISLTVNCINSTFASVDRDLVAEVSNTGGKDTASFKIVQAGRSNYSADPTITASDLTVPGPLTVTEVEASWSLTNAIAFYDLRASFTGTTGTLNVTRNSNRGTVTFNLPPNLPNYVLNNNVQVTLTVTTNRGSVSKTIRLIDSRRG